MAKARTADLARGKWRGILLTLGVDKSFLTGKHGPCPFCGGDDRFRFDNKDGDGTFICSQCGAGNGFAFLHRIKGWDFKTAAYEVDKVVGNIGYEKPKPKLTESARKRILNDMWKAGKRISAGDPVSLYLDGRGCDLPQNIDCLRFVAQCQVPNEAGCRPAMVAMISTVDGKPANLHRTFITPQGRKADMEHPRATMPGEIPDGSAIRLAMHGERLGIAEGIETALKAGKRFGLPVWAAINATMLEKWEPPEGVREVWVFGDNDPTFTGHKASYALANRLVVRRKIVTHVEIPPVVGTDWADAA